MSNFNTSGRGHRRRLRLETMHGYCVACARSSRVVGKEPRLFLDPCMNQNVVVVGVLPPATTSRVRDMELAQCCRKATYRPERRCVSRNAFSCSLSLSLSCSPSLSVADSACLARPLRCEPARPNLLPALDLKLKTKLSPSTPHSLHKPCRRDRPSDDARNLI